MVLSTATGDVAVVDGVDGTVVVTGEATGALAVMEPLGWGASDIVDRTDLRTFATLDADISIDHELLVRYHPLEKV